MTVASEPSDERDAFAVVLERVPDPDQELVAQEVEADGVVTRPRRRRGHPPAEPWPVKDRTGQRSSSAGRPASRAARALRQAAGGDRLEDRSNVSRNRAWRRSRTVVLALPA